MKAKPLKGIKVLDLTHRLPGPLAGHLLEQMGASVTKVEDDKFGDPFLDGFFKAMDPSFSLWYQALNEGKEIKRFSLKEECKLLQEMADESDIILMGLPPKLMQAYGLDFGALNDRRKKNSPFAMILMSASHGRQQGMHDLNALAKSRLLDLYIWEMEQSEKHSIISPPFLPLAGIGYGAVMAGQALGHLLKARSEKISVIETISLEESVASMFAPFYDEHLQQSGQKRFLHNGRYPCYNIYALKDVGHLAVASLEPKYWQRFCEILNLPLNESQRFSLRTEPQGEEVFHIISRRCKELSLAQAKELFSNQDCCVDVLSI